MKRNELYRDKRTIEINHARNTIAFWETRYTFRQIIELVLSVPELKNELEETIEAVHAVDNHV
mgnify:FL=1